MVIVAFGNRNKSGGFGAGVGSFGGGASKKIGLKTTGNDGGHFGKSESGSSVSAGGFGSKPKTGTRFGAQTNGDSSNCARPKSADNDMPMLFRADVRDDEKPSQIKRTKIVTFSNVEWKKFDNIRVHPSGAKYNEPRIHVVANRDNIEFHGYNVSEMDEGVYYKIGRNQNS